MPSLILFFLVPFVTSLLAFIFPTSALVLEKKFKYLAVAMSFLPLLMLFYWGEAWMNSQVNYVWIPGISIHFYLKIDSLSLIFLYLTALVIPISLLSMRSEGLKNPNVFYGLVLLLQGFLIGFFTARDLALFAIFWEAMLLPLYFVINLWGGAQRQSASLKFLIYMVVGSVFMVAAVLSLFVTAASLSGIGTFDFDKLALISSKAPHAAWLAVVFLLAFAVKTPLFPFHAWLPDAYCQAPTAGTILLSGILSKAGIYGILRIGVGFFPELVKEWSPLLLGLAMTGVFYGALGAWMQKDFKRLIAYSSFSHVNFILVGLFVWNQSAQVGALLQVVNHGITITALFLVAGWLEERLGSTVIGEVRGFAKYLPKLCWLTLFFVLSSVALPGTNNFVGEFMIFFGLFQVSPQLTAFLGLTIILSVVYMLRWMQKVYFETAIPFQERWIDLRAREVVLALSLVVLILWIGIYPTPVLKPMMNWTDANLVSFDERIHKLEEMK